MTEACIVGWAHSPFGKLEDPDGFKRFINEVAETLRQKSALKKNMFARLRADLATISKYSLRAMGFQ